MFDTVASIEVLEQTKLALEKNGFTVFITETAEEAKTKALELIPEGSEVMTMTSVTVTEIGLDKELNESGKYAPVRNKLYDPVTPDREKKRLGGAPEYVTGSVHAITQDGKVFVASNTGSQLGAYTYGADKVIWVVGGQKIVSNDQEASQRIWEYILPKETVRARKAYNLPESFNSNPSKIVEFNREITKDRTHIIIVKQVLGF